MRILLLNDRIPPENRGGAGIVVWRLAREFHAAGHDVHVIAATDRETFSEARDGIPTVHLHAAYPDRWRGWFSLYNPQVSGALRDLIAQIQPDIVNAHNIHQYLTYHSLTIAHDMGIPAVFSSHDVMPVAYHKLDHFIDPADPQVCTISADDYRLPPLYNVRQMRLRYNPLRNWRIRHVLRHHVQACTTPSRELARALAANDLPLFTPVHNGFDAAKFAVPDDAIHTLRDDLDLHGRKIILFAGRLTAAKGMHQVLAALRQLIPDVPEALLLVLSSVELNEQVPAADYADLRRKHIRSGGWLSGEALAAAYHLADVVVTPSIYLDPFPTVNLEAMATRTPVIATCFGGSPEVVAHGETGYIVNPFDTATFAGHLRRLLTNDGLRQQMGQAGYDRLHTHFSLQQQVTAMLSLYADAARA